MKTLIPFLAILLLFLMPHVSKAQETNDSLTYYQVETVDGNVFIGKILSKDEKMVVLKTDNLGVLNISFKNIKEIKPLTTKNIVKGELWPENPHATRYFYLPNGYGLKKGEGYYQNTWVLFNQVSYGLTDNFSMGAGLIPTFLFGANGVPVWITPKLSFPVKKDKWNIGVGAIVGTYLGENSGDVPILGLAYGVSTFGSMDKNFTIGAGYGFIDNDWGQTPVISLGGTVRTGKKHYLLTENYFFFIDEDILAMIWVGGRFASNHLAIDYGLIIPAGTDMNTLVAIPWLGLTVPFGSKQKGYVQGR